MMMDARSVAHALGGWPASVPHNWDDMSLDALWAALNRAARDRYNAAPQSTYDAAVYELRTYGIAQLEKPNCRRRLADLSTAQVRELIAALIRLRPKYPKITDELIGKVGDQL
jgi:hypothetical protein